MSWKRWNPILERFKPRLANIILYIIESIGIEIEMKIEIWIGNFFSLRLCTLKREIIPNSEDIYLINVSVDVWCC